MGRQGEQPVDAVGNGLGFEQLAELGHCFAEVLRVVTGHLLKFTGHDARQYQGDTDPMGTAYAISCTFQVISPDSSIRSSAAVIGSLKRRGPALPGLR